MSTEDRKDATAPPGEYTYYETPGTGAADQDMTETALATSRPLPAVPGQSCAREAAATDMVTDGMQALQLGQSRNSHFESFFLKQLGNFKGDYNGDAITEWVERVDLLKDILKPTDQEIIRLLPLRMSARASEFVRAFLRTRGGAEHTWANLKKAMLTQFGGKVEPTQLVNQLQQARMERNTPVRDFALQVGRLARLAYPELSSDTGTPEQQELQRSLFNRIAIEQFTAGLPPLLSRPIFENRVTDFQQAVDMAAHHEEINARFMRRSTIHAIHEETAPVPVYSVAPYPQGDSYHGPPYQLGNQAPNYFMAPINQAGEVSSGGTDPSPRNTKGRWNGRKGPYGRANRSVVCHRCHQPGHYKRECMNCTICGEWGHKMVDCRNIVCAACKGTGHPANKCPKNLQSRGQTRLNPQLNPQLNNQHNSQHNTSS